MNALQRFLGLGGKIPTEQRDKNPQPGVDPYKIAATKRKVSRAAQYAPIAVEAESAIGDGGKYFCK
jgi:hypothetical protein